MKLFPTYMNEELRITPDFNCPFDKLVLGFDQVKENIRICYSCFYGFCAFLFSFCYRLIYQLVLELYLRIIFDVTIGIDFLISSLKLTNCMANTVTKVSQED